MNIETEKIQRIGNVLVDTFHYLALFIIGATVVWSAVYEYIHMMDKGYAKLKDILLLFIYLEMGAMIGVYFKTHRFTRAVPDIYCYYCSFSAFGNRRTACIR